MKHFTPPTGRRTRLAILLSALLAASGGVNAAGTAAGTAVDNTATLSYSVGTVEQTDIHASASFLVDNKVDVLVTGGETVTTDVVPGATAVVTTFTVTNQGNATQDFKLDIVSVISGNQFDPTSCTVSNVAIATGTGGTYTAGDQHINALTTDSVATVTVTCDIPNTAANGNGGLVALVATAKAANNGNLVGSDLTEAVAATPDVDIVFADGDGSDDVARDATHSARNTYTVTTAVLSVAKTVATICDPFNGTTNPKNIPGAVARWTITIANSGAVSATLSQISDALNATANHTTFDPDLITGTGGATACEFAAEGSGTPEGGANGLGVRIQSTNARPMVGSTPGATVTSSYFTGASDADGVTLSGTGLTAALGVDFATALPAGGTYTAGELKPDEIVTVYFNVGIN